MLNKKIGYHLNYCLLKKRQVTYIISILQVTSEYLEALLKMREKSRCQLACKVHRSILGFYYNITNISLFD